ncbi:MAG: hypothetical protein RQ756_04150 [Flavobacteriaceae bacterium]|nr:hypothetical protein [Flavobacteriaceae bacterium]
MRNIFLTLFLITSVSFANTSLEKTFLAKEITFNKSVEEQLLAKNCIFAIYENGEQVGTVIIQDVPDDVECSTLTNQAILIWRNRNNVPEINMG